MKALIALSIAALLLVSSVSAYISVSNPYMGSNAGSYANAYNPHYGRTYGTSHSAPRYTYSYQRNYANYGVHGQWQSPYTNAWGDRVQVYPGFTRDPSISYRFSNERYQSRYNSYCASHPGFWAC